MLVICYILVPRRTSWLTVLAHERMTSDAGSVATLKARAFGTEGILEWNIHSTRVCGDVIDVRKERAQGKMFKDTK